MLREISNVRQVPGEPRRRWFNDEAMDPYVWLNDKDDFMGFQLTYGKPQAEKALTWRIGSGFTHAGVDEGTRPGKYPGSPILVADGVVDADAVLLEFQERAPDMDTNVKRYVMFRITEKYKVSHHSASSDPKRVWLYATAVLGGIVIVAIFLVWN